VTPTTIEASMADFDFAQGKALRVSAGLSTATVHLTAGAGQHRWPSPWP
jgi:hypothetical protein